MCASKASGVRPNNDPGRPLPVFLSPEFIESPTSATQRSSRPPQRVSSRSLAGDFRPIAAEITLPFLLFDHSATAFADWAPSPSTATRHSSTPGLSSKTAGTPAPASTARKSARSSLFASHTSTGPSSSSASSPSAASLKGRPGFDPEEPRLSSRDASTVASPGTLGSLVAPDPSRWARWNNPRRPSWP